jgi:hypothetical protein
MVGGALARFCRRFGRRTSDCPVSWVAASMVSTKRGLDRFDASVPLGFLRNDGMFPPGPIPKRASARRWGGYAEARTLAGIHGGGARCREFAANDIRVRRFPKVDQKLWMSADDRAKQYRSPVRWNRIADRRPR